MSSTDKHDEWARDMKTTAATADPVVPPEYTLHPPSARAGATGSAPAAAERPIPESESECDGPRSAWKRIVRSIGLAVLAIGLPPFILAGAGLAASLAAIFGVGKLLEATGQMLSVVPETLYKACVGGKARAAWRAARGRPWAAGGVDVESAGTIAI
ncbi:hypothetical protein BC628DRAFT_858731 [Trametes gibbosa]|nr:hypothetical protein BC628DRAFT_858731 [Trametes gibbosa]